MKYNVIALRRADADIVHICRWIAEHSLSGAEGWLDAYNELITRLERDADSYPAAMEDQDCNLTLKEALFRTRRGSTYRAVFTIAGDEVRVLRIRGPGQPPLQDDELL